ncbi:MAG: flagellar type III secretion system pore protein FliP [Gammaproteobacteria bacterium]
MRTLRALLAALKPLLGISALMLVSSLAQAEPDLPLVTLQDNAEGGQTYSLKIQLLAIMTMLTVLPALVISMTAFTRIIIVLAILRQALGTMSTPSNQILLGLSLFLTFFVMSPVLNQVNDQALTPYLNDQLPPEQALELARAPLQAFMLEQTRENDLALFLNLSGSEGIESRDNVPFSVLVPAFMTSELKTAFTMGFLLFIPFLIIDLVVASVLMAMGMMMLSPMMISTPFKILLFVLVDGWALIMGTLAASFVP